MLDIFLVTLLILSILGLIRVIFFKKSLSLKDIIINSLFLDIIGNLIMILLEAIAEFDWS